jgi:DNA replication protein DnaC
MTRVKQESVVDQLVSLLERGRTKIQEQQQLSSLCEQLLNKFTGIVENETPTAPNSLLKQEDDTTTTRTSTNTQPTSTTSTTTNPPPFLTPQEIEENEYYETYVSQSMTYSPEQQRAIEFAVNDKKSLLICGATGTGKTFIARHIASQLRHRLELNGDDSKTARCKVIVNGLTGFSATLVGGTTMNTYLGYNFKDIYTPWKRALQLQKELKACQVLIFDDISIMHSAMFDEISKVLITVRNYDDMQQKYKISQKDMENFRISDQILNNYQPFDGIQLIIVGDPLGLAPILTDEQKRYLKVQCRPIFHSSAFQALFSNKENIVELTRSFRQTDPQFADLLNRLRLNQLVQGDVEAIEKLQTSVTIKAPPQCDPLLKIKPTKILFNNREAEDENGTEYRKLVGTEGKYVPQKLLLNTSDYSSGDRKTVNQNITTIMKHHLVGSELKLKVGTQVLLVKSISNTLQCGARGVVERFVDLADDHFNYSNPKHQTLANNKLSTSWKKKSSAFLPVVRFTNGETVVIRPVLFRLAGKNGGAYAMFQIPLKVAFVFQLFRIQGFTLDLLTADFHNAVHESYHYETFGRARSFSGLQVFNFIPGKINANHECVKWYAEFHSPDPFTLISPKKSTPTRRNSNITSPTSSNKRRATDVFTSSDDTDSQPSPKKPRTNSQTLSQTATTTTTTMDHKCAFCTEVSSEVKGFDQYEFETIPDCWINAFERAILLNYLFTHKKTVASVRKQILSDIDSKTYEVRKCNNHHSTREGQKPKIALYGGQRMTSSHQECCSKCAQELFYNALYHYRSRIPAEELPEKAKKNSSGLVRGNCWYGVHCFSSLSKNPAHATTYNHVCEQASQQQQQQQQQPVVSQSSQPSTPDVSRRFNSMSLQSPVPQTTSNSRPIQFHQYNPPQQQRVNDDDDLLNLKLH